MGLGGVQEVRGGVMEGDGCPWWGRGEWRINGWLGGRVNKSDRVELFIVSCMDWRLRLVWGVWFSWMDGCWVM